MFLQRGNVCLVEELHWDALCERTLLVTSNSWKVGVAKEVKELTRRTQSILSRNVFIQSGEGIAILGPANGSRLLPLIYWTENKLD